ncbi:isoaspartyl peptidase/L-asparaginase family protein [Nitrosospira sp. Nsp13]|uniref:isoaspartyl peptidase/L-asparaginase family protein n=1 Tax=Nitrosospira sp. Nsp13 TaxID=1855332 RepID=UPI000888F8A8|nr:isoaspartyl peptidase/L-asparaginase [Nitrosospira sp. Nsp13]SCX96187.1 beta-aspartyl-peptidase (threonine type) [Nitrosospira sp. Nsp13]
MTIQTNTASADTSSIRLVIHGGAGTIARRKLTADLEQAYRQVLSQSLAAGHAVLEAGGSSIDAVIAAIMVMEDSPLFNAGKGSVFSNAGRNELDASIMDGSTRMAGAVAGVTTIRNPIRAAHAVMTQSAHVMLIGQGADAFAAEKGLEIVDPSYFHTQFRWNQLQKAIAEERILRDHDAGPDTPLPDADEKRGTVGAVALDRHGNLAAGTSTGGLTNKRFGRVGDSPVIGAGTYADNRSVAVSATGTGEIFIRTVAAFNTAAQVRLQHIPITEAADNTLAEIAAIGGDGGLIVLDAKGNYAMRFNTSGMYRGTIGSNGIMRVEIFS